MSTNRPKTIMHYDMDCFYAAIEMRDDPSLVGKPVAVGGEMIIATANYEARKFGVHSAMKTIDAKKLCPSLIVIPGDKEKYFRISEQIHELALKITYKIEFIALDEGYIDITDVIDKYPSKTYFAGKFRERIKQITGLSCSVGIGFNKLSAKIASNAKKPGGQYLFKDPESFAMYLKNKDVSIIPGVGKKFKEILNQNSIYKIEDLYAYSLSEMNTLFGASRSALLYTAIRGIDNSEVEYQRPTKSISNETTFKVNLNIIQDIEDEISDLFDTSYKRMIDGGFLCRTVSIKVRFSDMETFTRAKTFERPTDVEYILRGIVFDLLDHCIITKPVRLLGVTFGGLSEKAARQLTL